MFVDVNVKWFLFVRRWYLFPRKLVVYFLLFLKLRGQRRFTILICDTYIHTTFHRRYMAEILPIRRKTIYNQSHYISFLPCSAFELTLFILQCVKTAIIYSFMCLRKQKLPYTIKIDTKLTREDCLYHIDENYYLINVLHAYTGTLDIWYWLAMFNCKMKLNLKTK